jgi:hypothetical protein
MDKPFRYLIDVRDRSLIEWRLPITPPGTARTLILWDADRDTRLLTVLEALRYRSAMMLPAVVAISESRGTIDFWTPSCADAAAVTRALQSAADAALQPLDQWRVNAPTVVPVKAERCDWSALPVTDPARTSVVRNLGQFADFGAL